MHRFTTLTLGLTIMATVAGCAGQETGTLAAAATALNAADTRSIEFSGTGRWFQFGQAPNPTLPWPPFDVSSFTARIAYDTPAARVEMVRTQVVDPGRERPAPVEQRPVQLVSGTFAWNLATPPGAAAGAAPTAQPQPAAVDERLAEIWTTPHGFLRAAAANNATSTPANGGSEITFTAGGHRYLGHINAQSQLVHVQTWIDNTVLGDTLVDTTFSEYKDFGGVLFPTRIARSLGGHPVLDLTVSAVTANPAAAAVDVPDNVRTFTPPAVTVAVEKLADGVHYLRGGSHHSIAIEQRDHIVLIEAPQNEARSLAVIAKAKEIIPDKPIRYLVNSHVHFDHSGGLRTYVDEGATIVTHELNKPYYEDAWKAPRTLNADRLAKANKAAAFETVGDKHVLTDGKRSIEIHKIAGSGHNDAYLMVYLPTEKILVQVDSWAPLGPNQTPPAVPSPYAINFYENIERLKLDVRQIAALHGPGTATLDDLRKAVGRGTN